MMSRIPFETYMRSAAMQMLLDYAAMANVKLQKYPGRPRSVNPPCAYVERIRETIVFDGMRQRVVQVDIRILWGLFDSAEAVAQRDAFVDGFVDWAKTRFHQAGANTLIAAVSVEDIPSFVNDWVPPEQQRNYYATRIRLEGYAEG